MLRCLVRYIIHGIFIEHGFEGRATHSPGGRLGKLERQFDERVVIQKYLAAIGNEAARKRFQRSFFDCLKTRLASVASYQIYSK